MLAKLENDTFVFSGLRTHAQLLEASTMLMEDGKIRGFDAFAKDFNQVNTKYNQNYLEAEWQFALSSSQSAGKWAAIDQEGRYNLQYRTANDDRVRADHAALQDITLPVEDPFWLTYYPPNGWRCRCVAVEVLKTKYEVSDSDKANAAGDRATTKIGPDGKNKSEIFRFNPGAEQKVFPPKHPYNKVKGADDVKTILQPEFTPEKLKDYEKKLGINVNTEIFEFLKKSTPLTLTNPPELKGTTGAYFQPDLNIVRIPIDERRKQSKWKAESVVYHEFGHAADWHSDLKKRKEVTDLMDKYRKELDFAAIEKRLEKMGYWAFTKGKFDLLEKVGAAEDTIMSLDPNYGSGHSANYWKREGNKEAEFIAHAFENKFAGNEVFKKIMPDLYRESVELIDKLKPKPKK
ncbi:phage minor head protein [Chryseobacterium sp.]|uniref:phage head morphogenesis protein n=1 Tax=Chryseobacterium sp. TaxID=1871047 RepID=UPI0012A9CFFA|nr:phage minor head protein [Chryseobacterium sp.]QFG53649.1 hypothetical protein F7R58_08820 [Chryseobacterium sp.]